MRTSTGTATVARKLPEVRRPFRPSSGFARSAVDVAVAFDDELAGGGVGVDELRQERDPDGHRDADGELLPRRQRRRVTAGGLTIGAGSRVGHPDIGGVDRLVLDRQLRRPQRLLRRQDAERESRVRKVDGLYKALGEISQAVHSLSDSARRGKWDDVRESADEAVRATSPLGFFVGINLLPRGIPSRAREYRRRKPWVSS